MGTGTPAGEGTPGDAPQAGVAAGKRVGPCIIKRELGRGGMGVVYLAEHRELKRDVALKVLLGAELASELDRRRFRREAEAIAALRHPNIVTVHETGEEAGLPYFTMEVVTGATLPDWSRAARPTLERSIRLMVRACDAIGYAHTRGVIHRDLKPVNIMVDERDEPQIMDFGLAKRLGGTKDSVVTNTGAVVGTPHYMSPEQATGDSSGVDARSDVFALGVILYELCAGDVPFRSDSLAGLIDKIVREDPPPLRSRAPSVPEDVELIVAKALAKDPAQRYWNAYALMSDLERWLRREPIHARRASPLYRARKWLERHRVVAAAVAVALAAGVGLILHSRLQESRLRRQVENALAARLKAKTQLAAYLASRRGVGGARLQAIEEAAIVLEDAHNALTEARSLAGHPELTRVVEIELDDAIAAHERARRILQGLIEEARAEAPPPHGDRP